VRVRVPPSACEQEGEGGEVQNPRISALFFSPALFAISAFSVSPLNADVDRSEVLAYPLLRILE
jgi:hypothetical protein